MKFTFTMKVPMRERLKLFWLGGLHLTIKYEGQHKIASCVAEAIAEKHVCGQVKNV